MTRAHPVPPPAPEAWGAALKAEYENGGKENGRVGQRLLAETETARVWTIRVAPGERVGLHRHQLDYVWTALCAGKSLSHYADGRVGETSYHVGMSRSFRFEAGDCMIHDLCNIGTTALEFVTIEYLHCQNPPLPIG